MIWLAIACIALAGLSFFGSRWAMAGAYNAASALGAGAIVLRICAAAFGCAGIMLIVVMLSAGR